MTTVLGQEVARRKWERFYGPVPGDWTFECFASLFRERAERSSNREAYPLYSFTIEDGVTPKTDRYEREFLLRDKENNEFALVHPGDFVFNPMNLRFGAISYSKVSIPVLVSGYYVVLILDESRCSAVFMEHMLRSTQMIDMYDRVAIGSLVEKRRVHLSILNDVALPCPSLAEQIAIATILSTWERGIRQLSDLIAAKLQFKMNLMQRLLTGKRRFNGFDDKWQEHRLGDVASVNFSGVDKNTVHGEENVRLCNYLDVYRNEVITNDMPFMAATASPAEIAKFSLRRHDVLITKDSETPDDIAKSAYVGDELNGVVLGYHLGLMRPGQDLYGPFLSRLMMIPQMRYRFTQIANGATRYGLPLDATRRMPISIPSVAEQERIANVADIADREIDHLRVELHALRMQKKGLMQKLLTGQVRVKP